MVDNTDLAAFSESWPSLEVLSIRAYALQREWPGSTLPPSTPKQHSLRALRLSNALSLEACRLIAGEAFPNV
ncbi:hypothetical protein BN946_scf184970.g27 [Trametes cinnabarina]|uniref:Uncharacterized protein n=1 Tax=Pycnoporus cinnabarinus TaxID=5643 RepID=A0A060SCT7_PYCCI|nr:hypothetical protein BN946_scf184970.g27 [Trametes cinnabarina]